MKYCNDCKCKVSKSLFSKHSNTFDGLQVYCKVHMRKRRLKATRTKKGLVSDIYSTQKSNSKTRGHNPPSYSVKELREWLLAQKLYHHLHHLWRLSNYDKLLRPSIDRLDEDLPYSFSNIQLMTWAENTAKEIERKRRLYEKIIH